MKNSETYDKIINQMLYAFNHELDVMGGSGGAGMRKALKVFLMSLPEIEVYNQVENNSYELYEELLILRGMYP